MSWSKILLILTIIGFFAYNPARSQNEEFCESIFNQNQNSSPFFPEWTNQAEAGQGSHSKIVDFSSITRFSLDRIVLQLISDVLPERASIYPGSKGEPDERLNGLFMNNLDSALIDSLIQQGEKLKLEIIDSTLVMPDKNDVKGEILERAPTVNDSIFQLAQKYKNYQENGISDFGIDSSQFQFDFNKYNLNTEIDSSKMEMVQDYAEKKISEELPDEFNDQPLNSLDVNSELESVPSFYDIDELREKNLSQISKRTKNLKEMPNLMSTLSKSKEEALEQWGLIKPEKPNLKQRLKKLKVENKNWQDRIRVELSLELIPWDNIYLDLGPNLSYEFLNRTRINLLPKVRIGTENQLPFLSRTSSYGFRTTMSHQTKKSITFLGGFEYFEWDTEGIMPANNSNGNGISQIYQFVFLFGIGKSYDIGTRIRVQNNLLTIFTETPYNPYFQPFNIQFLVGWNTPAKPNPRKKYMKKFKELEQSTKEIKLETP